MRQLKIVQQPTNREDISFDKYLQDIGKEGLITSEEEVVLAQRIKAGDRVALEKLTKANLRFVVSVAKQYQNQGLSLSDLINAGNLGLIKAAKRFDETRGFKFISYAVWWIRQSILQSLTEQSGSVSKKIHDTSIKNKVSKIVSTFEQENEREPSSEEVTDIFLQQGISVSWETTYDNVKRAMSPAKEFRFDAPRADGEGGDSYDIFSQNTFPAPDEGFSSEMGEEGSLFAVVLTILKVERKKTNLPEHLSAQEVLEIFLKVKNGTTFQRHICEDFEISKTDIQRIVRFVQRTLEKSEHFKKEVRNYGGRF